MSGSDNRSLIPVLFAVIVIRQGVREGMWQEAGARVNVG